MITREQAFAIRAIIEKAANALTDEDALKAPVIFEHWQPNHHYPIGKRLYYDGKLYSVLIEHDSLDTWMPDVAPSLFAEVLIPDPGEIPEWIQPGSTNPYMKGDKVRHNNKTWISTMDYNVFEPGVAGWEEIEN
jgi:hypothetical protein